MLLPNRLANFNRLIVTAIATIFFAIQPTYCQQSNPYERGTGTVKGIFKVPDGARVVLPTARVILTDLTGKKIETMADGEGAFEVRAPEGIYKFEAIASDYFYPYRRASLRVKEDEIAVIDVVPLAKIASMGLEVGNPEYVVSRQPPAKYLPLGDALLRYYDKRSRSYEAAEFTHDTTTVRADSVTIRKDGWLDFTGSVVIEENGKQRNATRALLDLRIRPLNFVIQESVASLPYPVRMAAPKYPLIAHQAQITGTINMRVTTNDEGDVLSARQLSGSPMFTPECTEAARQWKFSGKGSHDITFEFRLKGERVSTARAASVWFERPAKIVVTINPLLPSH